MTRQVQFSPNLELGQTGSGQPISILKSPKPPIQQTQTQINPYAYQQQMAAYNAYNAGRLNPISLAQQQQKRVNDLVLNTDDLKPEEATKIRMDQQTYAKKLLKMKTSELDVKSQAVARAKRMERHDENDAQYRRVLELKPVRINNIMDRIREKDDNFINEGDAESYSRLATSVQDLRNMKDKMYTERVNKYKNEFQKIDDFDKFNEIGQKEREAYDKREQVKRYIQGTFFDSAYKDPDLYIPISFGDNSEQMRAMDNERVKEFRSGLAWYTSHYANTVLFSLMGLLCVIALGNLYNLEYKYASDPKSHPEWLTLAISVATYVVGLGMQVHANRSMNREKKPSPWHSMFTILFGGIILGCAVAGLTERFNNKDPDKYNSAKNMVFGSILLFGLLMFSFARSMFAENTSGNMSKVQMTSIDTLLLGVSMMLSASFSLPVTYMSNEVCHDHGVQRCFKKMDKLTRRDLVTKRAYYGSAGEDRLQKCTENLPSDFISNILTLSVLPPSK